jgi:CheY-like chemotaxis protein
MSSKFVTIFMADDDPEDLELIQDALMKVDPSVIFTPFMSGNKLYEYLISCSDSDLPALIILDYNMPELNGAQVLAQLKLHNRFNPIPRVVLSTSNASIHANECIKNGAIDYFVKPDSMSEMEKLAKKLLELCKRD